MCYSLTSQALTANRQANQNINELTHDGQVATLAPSCCGYLSIGAGGGRLHLAGGLATIWFSYARMFLQVLEVIGCEESWMPACESGFHKIDNPMLHFVQCVRFSVIFGHFLLLECPIASDCRGKTNWFIANCFPNSAFSDSFDEKISVDWIKSSHRLNRNIATKR